MSVSSVSTPHGHQRHEGLIPGLPQDSYTVFATASSVRVYHAPFGSQEWCYSRLRGTLVFGKNNDEPDMAQASSLDDGKYWFRLLDTKSGVLKPVWIFKLSAAGFNYEVDKPFFHAFQGMSRQFGLLFDDDDEASIFHKKVTSETSPPPRAAKNRTARPLSRSKTPPPYLGSLTPPKTPLSPSMISLPASNSFIHVSHIGFNESGDVETSKGVNPVWSAVLSGHRVQDEADGLTTKTSDRNLKRRRDEGSWIGGIDERLNQDKGADEVATVPRTGLIRKLSSKGKSRRRLPTPSFAMF